MRYQEFFLTRFMTARCFIFVFLFFLNCVMTAEAGMVFGTVCFYERAESDKKEEFMGKTIDPDGHVESTFVEKEGKITIVERKQDDFFTILEGKVETESRYIAICTIKKAIEKAKECNEKDCPQSVIQLMRRELENCYKYKIFMSPGQYHITCGQCKTDVTSKYGPLWQDINFYLPDGKCQDSSRKSK